MASSVATPLEKQFSSIAGLDSMISTSALGSTNITLQFGLERDLDAAALDVQSAISAAQRSLPSTLPAPPTFRKTNPADAPVVLLALRSDTLPLSKVDEYAQNVLAPRLSTIAGVAQVSVYGSQKYAVRVRVDPVALAARGLGFDEVRQAVLAGNSNLPTGSLDGSSQSFIVESSGQLTGAADFRSLIVASRHGAPVRLEDVATVSDGVENERIASWFGEERAIILAVQRQPGTNTVQVVDAVRAVLPTIQAQLPPAIRLDLMLDRSQSIRESVHDVQFTLLLSSALGVLVIFVFLRKLAATVIPSLAIVLSIAGTFAVMHLLGFSLNNLSLMALTLAVGFVVDDAIVVIEDTGQIQISTEAAQDISFDAMAAHHRAVTTILLANPYIANFSSQIGAGGPNGTANVGRFSVRLQPRRERPPAAQIVQTLRPQLAQIPGLRVFAQLPPQIRLGGRNSKSQYQFTLSAVDVDQLRQYAPLLEARMRGMSRLIDVTSDLQLTSPQVFVHVDRDKASTLGISAAQIDSALYDAYGSRAVSSLMTAADEYDVIIEVQPRMPS